jgi:hypothetical protein
MYYIKEMKFHEAIVVSSSILGSVYLLSTSLNIFNTIMLYGNNLSDKFKNRLIIINGTIMFASAFSYGYLTYMTNK